MKCLLLLSLLAACGTSGPDDDFSTETGNAFTVNQALIVHASAQPLDGTPRPLTLIGLPGVMNREAEVTAGVRGGGAPALGVERGREFIVALEAALGDTIDASFSFQGETRSASIVVGANSLTTPSPSGTSLPFLVRNGAGVLADIRGLFNAEPPVAIYVENGDTALVSPGETTTTVTAVPGEQICAVKLLLPSDGASPSYCESAP